ncbi:MAG TPA: hypothetical protein VMU86_09625, partial [Steroidobacteraceae bacterium]|nr:hypothetical protein [Steroidobacteraceae bacterium]
MLGAKSPAARRVGLKLIENWNFFRAERGPVGAEEERLMQLFQNRAGLKKAYADLQDEFHLMRDRLKQQEGATVRIQEQLDQLGELLADPRSAYSAMVFFQLRALWKTCNQRLSAFAADLARRQEERESAKFREQCAHERAGRLAAADEQVREARARADELRAQLSGAEAEHGRLGVFRRYFKRRELQHALQTMQAEMASADGMVRDRQTARDAIVAEVAEPFPGIALAARRTINLAVIAYAELLCEQVDAHGAAAKAKEAVARRVHEMSFGTRAECEGYMQRIQKAIAAVSTETRINASVKVKLERLRSICE